MKKCFSFHTSLRKKLIISNLLLLLCITVILGIYFIFTYTNMLRKNTLNTISKATAQIESAANLNINLADSLLYSCLRTNTFQSWLNGTISLADTDFVSFNRIRSELSSIFMFNQAWTSHLVSSLYLIIDETMVPLYPGDTIPNSAEQEHGEILTLLASDTQDTSKKPLIKTSSGTLYYAKTYINYQHGSKITFLCKLNAEVFFASLLELPEGTSGYIIDSDHKIFFSNPGAIAADTTGFLPSEQDNFQNDLTTFRQLNKSEYSLIVSVPQAWFDRQIIPTMRLYLFIVLAILLIFATLSYFISTKLTVFLVNINTHMQAFQHKDYDTHMPAYQESDLNQISIAFNNMADEIRHLITTVYEDQLLIKDHELKLLQAQMNPHFLINILTVIGTTALNHHDMELYRMFSALTQLLDSNLLGGSLKTPFIPLEQELKYIQCYLYLQTIRYSDRMSYTIDIPSSLQSYYIPTLTVEPLVENAITHGMESVSSPCHILITARTFENQLIITVADSGNGFDTKILSTVTSDKKGHHISINNIRQRIANWFGTPPFGISHESSPGNGTTVTITLPILLEAPQEDFSYGTGHNCRG